MAKVYKFSDGYTVDEGSFYSNNDIRKQVAQRLGINYTGTSAQTSSMANTLFGGTTSGATSSASKGAVAKSSYSGAVTSASKGAVSNPSSGASSSGAGSYSQSSNVTNAQAEADAYRNKLKEMSNVTNIVDQSTWDAINTKFTEPDAYTQAMNYTNSYLEKLSSGKTSYTDRINALMDEIQNRDKFEYDADTDTLFQQALASAMSSGKTAMQDTIGQASALTGGYGSTYATSAGNQAYNSFIEDAYSNLPEYYQMAMEAYQMEGDEMYKQLSMLNDADATEYQRTYDAWSANFANAQNIYNNAYNLWSDNVDNAIQSAGLQLSEHGQIYDQTYKTYTAVADHAQQMYANEYNQWADAVNNAYRYAELAQRQTEFNQEMAFKKTQSAKTSGGGGGTPDSNGNLSDDMSLSNAEINAVKSAYNGAGGGVAGHDAVDSYLKGIGKYQETEKFQKLIDSYIGSADAEKGLPVWYQTWTISKDTKNHNNPFSKGNEDYNDEYVNLNGETMSYKELKKAINNSNMSEEEKKSFLKALGKQSTK